MEIFLKQFLPVFILAYLALYQYKSSKKELFPLYLLFGGFICLSSNYAFGAYRSLFQIIQICLITVYVIRYRSSFFIFNQNTLLSIYLAFILISLIGNSIDSGLYLSSLINFGVIIFVIAYINTSIPNINRLYDLLVVIEKLTIIIALSTIIVFIFENVRVELTMNNPNYLAFFLGIGLSISLFIRVKVRLVVVGVIVLAIILTGSRIIMISTFAVLMIKLFSNKQRWFVNSCLLILSAILFLPFINTDKILNTKRFSEIDEDVSAILRVEIIQASQSIISSNPINGLGYGQFQVKFNEYASKNSRFLIDVEEIVTHNDYLRIVDELGIPAFLFVLFILLREVYFIFKLSGNFRMMSASIFITVFLYSTSHNNLNTYMFWFCIMFPSLIYRLNLKYNDVEKIR